MADHLTTSLDMLSGLEAREVERRALESQRAGEVAARVTAFYLADVADRGLHQQLGFASLAQYARQRMRMAASTLRAYIRVGRRLGELPEIDRMFAEDKLTWSQVRHLVKVATEETQLAWGEWAAGKTVEEVKRMVSRREVGQLPTDPARRRIHTTKSALDARLNPVQLAVFNLWRQSLEEKVFGGPVSDGDMVMWMAHKGLRELSDSDQSLTVRPPRPDLDPLNHGEEMPLEERDSPTGSTLREQVLERDGVKCVCCGSTHNLSAHHRHWRRYGGATVAENLVTLCEDCHSLVHDRFLILRGEVTSLEFLDSEGREQGERLPPKTFELKTGYDSGATRVAPGATHVVSFNEVPTEVDAEWWRRHRHLFTWNQKVGGLEFEPGRAPTTDRPEDLQPVEKGLSCSSSPGLDGLVGQERVRRHLRVAIRSAKQRGESLGHVLLSGPSGLGKTSLARAIAKEIGGSFRSAMAPVIFDPVLLVRDLTSLPSGSVLFLDEAHRLPVRVMEVLYEALEDGYLDLPVRCGWDQRTLRIELAEFTLVAATTEVDRLPQPFRNRFVHRGALGFYNLQELGEICDRAAVDQGLVLTPDARDRLAGAARDTPREGLAHLQAVCDEATSYGRSEIDVDLVDAALARTGTTPLGVTAPERDYLRVLAGAKRPLGLGTLAAKLGTSRRTVQRVYEPFLLRRGLVRLTIRGRCLEGAGVPAATA